MIRCVSCGEEYDNDEIIYTCEKCGSVLELVSDFDVSKDIFDGEKILYGNLKNVYLLMNLKLFHSTKVELHFANATNWGMD